VTVTPAAAFLLTCVLHRRVNISDFKLMCNRMYGCLVGFVSASSGLPLGRGSDCLCTQQMAAPPQHHCVAFRSCWLEGAHSHTVLGLAHQGPACLWLLMYCCFCCAAAGFVCHRWLPAGFLAGPQAVVAHKQKQQQRGGSWCMAGAAAAVPWRRHLQDVERRKRLLDCSHGTGVCLMF
jgi:hypothetical protein